jgi:hypothetical protein
MINDTADEKNFRGRYALELRKKKITNSINPNVGFDELSDEARKVKRQELITPGRRGEQIKYEEIGKEIIRRCTLEQHKVEG